MRAAVRWSEEALEHYGLTNAKDPGGWSGESIPARHPLAFGLIVDGAVVMMNRP